MPHPDNYYKPYELLNLIETIPGYQDKSDNEIGRIVRRTGQHISHFRKRFGINKNIEDIQRRCRDNPRKVNEFTPMLGKVPDNQIAKKYGLSRERIRQLRSRLNIPKFKRKENKDELSWNRKIF